MQQLERLQNWYSSQCDGDWEHDYGIFIENVDNPGWWVKIDLAETELEDKQFEEIDINRTETDWFFCRVEAKKFVGSGGSHNLVEIIEAFLTWSDTNQI